ncbi:MAG: hypothetical protein JKY56_00470 [Kofleriaceae bacterium]|nr:hypothetical protein [Kofleriaceae bacterium]
MRFTNVAFFLLAMISAVACGDSQSDAPEIDGSPSIDARPGLVDAASGVVCAGALASYPGMLFSPMANDDGQTFVFNANLTSDSPADGLQISISESAVDKLGTFSLPSADWQVALCIDDSDGTCENELKAVSGTLVVTQVSGRFRANLNESIYADDLAAPSCSSALRQASFDVAILGPI